MAVEYISSRSNGSQTRLFCSNLIFQNEEFSNFSACPLSVRKIGAQLYLSHPRNIYAVALEKTAVKPVARLHNIITSCQSSKVFTAFKFVRDKPISS